MRTIKKQEKRHSDIENKGIWEHPTQLGTWHVPTRLERHPGVWSLTKQEIFLNRWISGHTQGGCSTAASTSKAWYMKCCGWSNKERWWHEELHGALCRFTTNFMTRWGGWWFDSFSFLRPRGWISRTLLWIAYFRGRSPTYKSFQFSPPLFAGRGAELVEIFGK